MSSDALYVNEQANNDGFRLRFNRAKRGAPRPKPDSQRPKRPKSIIQERRHKEQILSHCFFFIPGLNSLIPLKRINRTRPTRGWMAGKFKKRVRNGQSSNGGAFEVRSRVSDVTNISPFRLFPAPGESSFADFGYFSLAFIFSRSHSERTRRTMARMNSQ